MTPITGTAEATASDTLLKLVVQPPQARIVAQRKNIAAFTTNKKNTLFCKRLPQNRALSCSLLLAPCVT